MSRETWVPLGLVVGLALTIGGLWSWSEASREAAHESEREARRREREVVEARRAEEARSESAEVLGDILPGVELGGDVDAVRGARPEGAVTPSTSHVDPGFDLYEERLANGAQVMYAFDAHTHRLSRVQVLSQLDDVNAIAPHLAAMHDRYGAPTGVWDCRDESGIATRRFTWRRAHVGLADIVLLYGSRISLTLYLTTNEQMALSLQRAACRPTPSEQLDQFPTSSPAAIQEAQHEDEGAPPR